MNLKILALLLLYYSVISLVLISGGSTFEDYDNDIDLDNSAFSEDEQDLGGLFGSGISFSRFFGLVTIGIGLPSTTPQWFSSIFLVWQSAFLIFSVGFVASSLWNG